MIAARSESEASAETLRVRSKKARRQHRITISADMGPLWDWFKDVPHKAAAREIDFLLRLGVLAATGVRAGNGQAGRGTDSPALSVSSPPAPASSSRRTDAQLDSVPPAEGSEARVEQVAGWNFTIGGLEAAAAAVDRLSPYAHWPSARTYPC